MSDQSIHVKHLKNHRTIVSENSGNQSMIRASTLNSTNDNFQSFLLGSNSIDKRRTLDDSIEAIPEREDLYSKSLESGERNEPPFQYFHQNAQEDFQTLDS